VVSEQGGRPDLERRLRRAATAAATGRPPEPSDEPEEPDEVAAARSRLMEHRTRWVDLQVRQAMERGDFDDLPGAGKPLEGLGTEHDPDWWVKKLVEREQISVLPPALELRKEDAELEARLDRITAESEVREELGSFNARVRRARMQLLGGPPVITPERDLDAEVEAWRERRTARVEAQRAALAAQQPEPRRRRWFGRGR
jgi:hypothetical protein